ncbi:MAG TPA: nucleotidyltransferase family protein, partial [Polyangia bacterium]|nr:nucleotidyltransferase family protein [Polyangia bacterium]
MALLAVLKDPPRAAALSAKDPVVLAVARHHRLSPLLSITCGDTLPSSLAEACRRDRVVTAARNMILGQVAEECLRALAAAGIPTIVLKGLDYETRLYAAAGARPTADVDLLVPDEKRRPAFAVLDRLGFEPRAAAPGFDDPDYHEVAWTRTGAEVDLHMALAPLARCRIDYSAIWREAEPSRLGATDALVLARPHAAVFHALHMAIDHFDLPAIYLLDLDRLLPTVDDAERAERLARTWRCWRPLATARALVAALLETGPEVATPFSRRVVMTYGTTRPLPRPEQLY